MFVYANDPERIKNQIDELRCKLDDLSSETAQIANFIILTTERPKSYLKAPQKRNIDAKTSFCIKIRKKKILIQSNRQISGYACCVCQKVFEKENRKQI